MKGPSGKVELQDGYDWTRDGQILFTPSTGEAWMEADFIIENEEYGRPIPRVPMTIDIDFYDPEDEVKVLDLFTPQLEVRSYYLGGTTLMKGKHTIRFE